MDSCDGDTCMCGHDISKWGDIPYWERVGTQLSILVAATAVGGGVGFGVGVATILIFEGNPDVVQVPATREASAKGIVSGSGGTYRFGTNGRVIYTGLGDPNANDPEWMNEMKKRLMIFSMDFLVLKIFVSVLIVARKILMGFPFSQNLNQRIRHYLVQSFSILMAMELKLLRLRTVFTSIMRTIALHINRIGPVLMTLCWYGIVTITV